MSFKMDWCTHDAAKYAVENWHYSGCMPSGKTVKIGVWENDRFIGCVIFAIGANPNIASYGGGKACELARIALTNHKTPVTRIVSIALKMLRKHCPNLDAVISYADLDRHPGTIYKAGNWKLDGSTTESFTVIHGKKIHPRTVYSKYGTRSIEWLRKHVDSKAHKMQTKGKKRFILYFKRAGSKDIVAKSYQGLEGGENPTSALQE